MEPSTKKRSIFGLGALFQRSTTPSEQESKKDATMKDAAPSLPRPATSASAPESPAKRASDSQMATRKIIGRPHGPSSKLSHSFTASDLTRTVTIGTPRRMPGDNPNKPPSSLSTAIVSRPNTNFTGQSSTRTNVFRSTAISSRPGLPNYSSPRGPISLNQSFPPITPGRAKRAATAELNGRALPQPSTSGDLFKMRIQSPPRHLTGEMLAKEVPSELNRTGSVYADEFLAHYCPPDLDEQQRRQFFCILDLRRLKYAADEVFTKKDWKINVLNFAKEYEKSRSLIMLRYGLYEFKTVRASEAVKKEWKEKHNIPDSDDEEEETAPRTNGGAKRKASVELTPHSVALSGPVSSANKRTRAPEISAKNKRKADEEPEESSQPAKLQKPGPLPSKAPSATKSLFESVANNTPVKALKASSTSSLFGSSTTAKPNGLFASTPKPTASSNIFGHLSDASKNSGNEGADEDSDSGSEAEDEDTEEASGSEEQTSSGEGSSSGKKATVNGTSGSSSDAGESFSQGRSLFERITRGADGKPVRKLDTHDGSLFPTPAELERTVSPVKEQAAPVPKPAPAAPANQTWNANTPIKFSAPAPAAGSSLFGSTAPKPAAPSGSLFGSSKPEETSAKESPAPTNLFGGAVKKAEESSPASETTPKAPTANLFSGFQPKPADSSSAAAPVFGGFKPSPTTSTGSSLFGSSTAAPASAEPTKEEKAATVPGLPTTAPTSFTFGGKSISVAADNKIATFKPTDMFGENKKDIAPAQPINLFGQTKKEESPAVPAASTPSASSLFGGEASKPATTSSLFGTVPAAASTATTSSTEEPKKFVFGSTDVKSTTPSLFGSSASTPAPEPAKPAETKSLFGTSTTAAPAAETKSLFGASTTAPSTGTSLFGSTTQPAATNAPLFGASTSATPAAETKSLFGSATPAPESKSLFGSTTPAPETKPLFGSTTPAPEVKPLFGTTPAPETKPLFGSTTATETKSLFGTTSAPEAKPFFGGSTIQPDSKPPASLFANAPTPAPSAPPASTMFSFGGSQATVPATQSFTFGSTPASQPAAPAGGSIFGNAGAGASTSFSFAAGGNSANTSFNNPFSSGQDGPPTAPTSFNFGSSAPAATQSFTFGSTPAPSAGGAPPFSFGGASDASVSQNVPSSGPVFSFGQNPAGGSIFGNSLAPGGGTSTGTNTPFTFGGASSLATTPAAGTPEPSSTAGGNTAATTATTAAEAGNNQGTNADGDEAPQEHQISLTDGGKGEEDESVIHEVRAKAMKYMTGEENDSSGGDNNKKKGWQVQGIGNLKLLRHKTTGAVRLLLRAEPRGHIALNKLVLPNVTYKVEPPGAKAVKVVVAKDNGKGLETWMVQVKTKEMAEELARKLEGEKKGNEKKKE